MANTLRVAIAGLGTVGGGVVKILQSHKDLITARAGRCIEIVAVAARSPEKDRGVDLSSYAWEIDPLRLPFRDDVDVVVELIGGGEGVAKDLAEATLAAGKTFVTANKALLAHHGYELAQRAENNDASLFYEAAVAGGIPVIKALREGFAGNEIKAVYGILNGTCNYILTAMRETGRDFDVILKEAQSKGYAEADPTFDVEGIDAAHKLSILTALAFGVKPEFENLETVGINRITATDINAARELGYRIKLLGVARRWDNGKITQSVEPCLVPVNSQMGAVDDVFNAVEVIGDFVDTGLLVGRGAGEGPTASAVLADLIDAARGHDFPVYGVKTADLKVQEGADPVDVLARYYLRLIVLDEPGVMADVAAAFKAYDVSMESVVQHGRDLNKPVALIMTTHEASKASVKALCVALEKLDSVIDAPTLMRLESL